MPMIWIPIPIWIWHPDPKSQNPVAKAAGFFSYAGNVVQKNLTIVYTIFCFTPAPIHDRIE
jgi:hypothetical protein